MSERSLKVKIGASALTAAALIFGGVVATNPPSSIHEKNQKSCTCGTICARKISCVMPACANEHGKPIQARIMRLKDRLELYSAEKYMVKLFETLHTQGHAKHRPQTKNTHAPVVQHG